MLVKHSDTETGGSVQECIFVSEGKFGVQALSAEPGAGWVSKAVTFNQINSAQILDAPLVLTFGAPVHRRVAQPCRG